MKRKTTPTLQVSHPLDMALVATVDFLFKHSPREDARKILIKRFPGEVTEKDGVFFIPFTEAETALFTGGCQAYCDPRVILHSGQMPAVEVFSFPVEETLWGEDDG
jgi:hypothetical protein